MNLTWELTDILFFSTGFSVSPVCREQLLDYLVSNSVRQQYSLIHTHTYIQIWTYMCIYAYTCIYIYTHIYMYIHTQKISSLDSINNLFKLTLSQEWKSRFNTQKSVTIIHCTNRHMYNKYYIFYIIIIYHVIVRYRKSIWENIASIFIDFFFHFLSFHFSFKAEVKADQYLRLLIRIESIYHDINL